MQIIQSKHTFRFQKLNKQQFQITVYCNLKKNTKSLKTNDTNWLAISNGRLIGLVLPVGGR